MRAVAIRLNIRAMASAPATVSLNIKFFSSCIAFHKCKNFLLAGSAASGHAEEMLRGLLNTVNLDGLNPEAYLRFVLSNIADHSVYRVGEFLRWNAPLKEYVVG